MYNQSPYVMPVAPALSSGYGLNNGGLGNFNNSADLLVLLLFLGFAGNNGNGGFFGGGNSNIPTQTAAIVQQDNMRSQIAGIQSDTGQLKSFAAGLADGQNRIQDKQLELRTDLCQLGNNITQQINAAQVNNNERFCALNQSIIDNRLAVENKLNCMETSRLERENAALKEQLQSQTFLCNNNAQTDKIIAAINARSCQPCGFGYAPYNCNPCGLTALGQQIVEGLQQINAATQANTTTLGAVLTRVNQIPTTAA